MTRGAACLAFLALLIAGTARAEGARSDVPVDVVVNAKENGKRVYSVPVTIGATRIRAVLDTGSVPLLVLPGQLAAGDATPTGRHYSITYGGDRFYKGNIEQGTAHLGSVVGPIDFVGVTQAGCLPSAPNCVIAGEPAAKADFGGEYPAIVGARPNSQGLSSALVQLGAQRFVLRAPRLNRRENVGHLILNPSANETSRFRPLAMIQIVDTASGAPFNDAVHGCLRDLTRDIGICGAIFFDSGRTGITVYQQQNKPEVRRFARGDRGRIEFVDGTGGMLAGVDFPVDFNPVLRVDFADTYGRYTAAGSGEPIPMIMVGQAPYLGLDVLTDFGKPSFAVAARPPQADGLVGHVP